MTPLRDWSMAIRKDTGEVVLQSDVTRMAEANNDYGVVLTDDEIAAGTSQGPGRGHLLVPVEDITATSPGLYQVRPRSEGQGQPGHRGRSDAVRGMRARKVERSSRSPCPAQPATRSSPPGELRLVLTADAVREPRA